MFFKKELLKSINENFYKNHQDVLFPLSMDSTNDEIRLYISKAQEAKLDEVYFEEVIDFYFNDRLTTPVSCLGKELKQIQDEMAAKVVYRMVGKEIEEVVQLLKKSPNSVLVGGAVRDSILGLKPKDWDFSTDIPYDELRKIFTDAGFTVKEEGKQFLVMICSKNGWQFEIANFRDDGTYLDGRRPESVTIGTPESDSFRRDFTINSLFLNLTTDKIQDFTGEGISDMINKRLKFVGKPIDRLKEDFLRVFRFYRFLDKLIDFKPGAKDLKAVRNYFGEACTKVTPERIRLELERMVRVLQST